MDKENFLLDSFLNELQIKQEDIDFLKDLSVIFPKEIDVYHIESDGSNLIGVDAFFSYSISIIELRVKDELFPRKIKMRILHVSDIHGDLDVQDASHFLTFKTIE